MNYAIGNVTHDKQVIKEKKKSQTKHNNWRWLLPLIFCPEDLNGYLQSGQYYHEIGR